MTIFYNKTWSKGLKLFIQPFAYIFKIKKLKYKLLFVKIYNTENMKFIKKSKKYLIIFKLIIKIFPVCF